MNDIAKSLYWENTGIDWMIIEDNATIILTTGNRTIFTTTDSISKHVSDLKLQDYSYYITIRNNACSVSDIVNELKSLKYVKIIYYVYASKCTIINPDVAGYFSPEGNITYTRTQDTFNVFLRGVPILTSSCDRYYFNIDFLNEKIVQNLTMLGARHFILIKKILKC